MTFSIAFLTYYFLVLLDSMSIWIIIYRNSSALIISLWTIQYIMIISITYITKQNLILKIINILHIIPIIIVIICISVINICIRIISSWFFWNIIQIIDP